MTQRLDYVGLTAAAMRGFGGVRHYLGQSSLPAALVDLVNLRVSLINGCAYCIDMHTRDLLKRGMALDKVVLIPVWREAGSLFSEQERAALAWAETVTRVAETAIPDSDYQAASAAFSEQELADLTIAIALMNAYNRLAISFRTPPAAVQR